MPEIDETERIYETERVIVNRAVVLKNEFHKSKTINLAYERFFKRTFTFEEAELYNKQWLRETLPYGTAK